MKSPSSPLKTPGVDGLRNEHLKLLSVNNKLQLLDMFNDVLRSADIPMCWFQYKIMPLKKKDSVVAEASGYRSIAMALSLRKLFERMLCCRLDWFIESNRRISNAQAGFMRSRSTSDNVIALWSAASLAFARDEVLVAVFLDIKGATLTLVYYRPD